jgi:hypothetical protein
VYEHYSDCHHRRAARRHRSAADEIATKILAIEVQRNELKKNDYERFKAAVAARRFLVVENQLERLIDLQIAAEQPVISPVMETPLRPALNRSTKVQPIGNHPRS